MDINSKILWKPGMEITAQTFAELDASIDLRQQTAARVSLNGMFGVLPGFDYSCKAVFVKNSLEIEGFECTAMLPSGKIISASEDVAVKVPLLYGSTYYLCAEFSDQTETFEKQDVEFVRPRYRYAFYAPDEIGEHDCLPVLKFNIKDGVFSLDEGYLPPMLMTASSIVFAECVKGYAAQIEKILSHHNMREGGGKRVLSQYLFRLQNYAPNGTVASLMELIGDIIYAINYYIVTPYAPAPAPAPEYSPIDSALYMDRAEEYINAAATILDGVEIKELTIEEYMEQIRKELREYAEGELHDKLLEELRLKLHAELEEKLRAELTEFVMESFRLQLHKQLSEELSEELKEKLYQALYDALYEALYIKPAEEEEKKNDFMPLI